MWFAIFAFSGLFLTGINYQTAYADHDTDVRLLVILTGNVVDDSSVKLERCTVKTNDNRIITIGRGEGVNNGKVIKSSIERTEQLTEITVSCMLDNNTSTEPITKEVGNEWTVIVVTDHGQ